MLFQQSVISFVAAIALATSVSASAIAARGSAPVCPAGPSPYCCGASLAPVNVPNNIKSSLTSLAPNLDQGKVVGQNCVTPPAQGWYCVSSTFSYRIQ
jgi:hypothetical protein